MVIVSLTTDWLRYKIVIVIQALCGVGVYALLCICTSFTSIIAVEILFGIFVATEVAYYTYTYSVVDIKYYQKVTSYTRAAHLIGRFFSGVISQICISTKLVDSYQLNFLTLGSLLAAITWISTLPPVKTIEPKSKTQIINLMPKTPETTLEQNDDEIVENIQELNKSQTSINDSYMSWKYIRSMCKEYNNSYVFKWSFWVITATCCFNQVISYIQSLWESLSHNECIHNACTTTSEWNGAVDAVYTIISTIVTFLCGLINWNMDKYSNFLIMITSIVQCVTLYTSVIYNSIYISYINYIIYCIIYQAMMTIARNCKVCQQR